MTKKYFFTVHTKILFLNFFLNFFCNKKMSMNFETTLNGRTFRGTVNVNDGMIYKQDGTKYSPQYQKRLQNTREYFIIMTNIKLMKVIEERKRYI